MNLRGYLRAMRKHWILVLLLTLLGTGAATAYTLRLAPKYASTVTFFVSTRASNSQTALQADQFAQRRINSYAGVVVSDRLAGLIIKKANLAAAPTDLASEITTTTDVNTVLLTATVTDTSAQRSLTVCDGIATELNALVNQLDNPGTTNETTLLNVISGPTLNPVPVSPRVSLNIGLGVLVGLALGIGLAIARELADVTLRSAEDVEGVAKRPVLARVASDSKVGRSPGLVRADPRSPRGEAFRQLRTGLQFTNVDTPLRVLVVTSSVAGEGKSLTSANLALVFAEAGQNVLLIEADLRQPRISAYLGLERAVGLTNVLAGRVGVEDVLQPWGDSGLTLLACGSIPPNPSELLGSKAMADLMATLRKRFDFIVIDSPPLLPVTDAAVLSSVADGVLMVVKFGRTTRAQYRAAVSSLSAVGARLVGTVMNMVPRKETPGGYGGYRSVEDPSLPALATPVRPADNDQRATPAAHRDAGVGTTSRKLRLR